jgi:ligand-binding sensor domain-containing protein
MSILCPKNLSNKTHALTLFFCFLFCAKTMAQTDSYRFDRITTEDGLSHNEVRGIFQDHLGFMWFVTLDGINRYDGQSFKIYKPFPGRDY